MRGGHLIKLVPALLVSLAEADPAFFCVNNEFSNVKKAGDIEFYQSCDEKCECSVFEVLCLKRFPEEKSM